MLLHEKLQTVRVLRPASRGSLRAGHPAYQGGEARTPEDPVAHAIAALLGRDLQSPFAGQTTEES